MAFTTTALLLAAGLGTAGGYYGHDVIKDTVSGTPAETPAAAPAPISRPAVAKRPNPAQRQQRYQYQPRTTAYSQGVIPQQVNMGTNYTYPHPTKVCYRMDPRTYRYYVSYCD